MAIRGVPLDTNKPLKTRSGRKARIICEDKKGNYPIIALIDHENDEYGHSFTRDGFFKLDGENDYDLFVDEPEQPENKIETVAQRKVVQIRTFVGKEIDVIYALCNDGKIFINCRTDCWKGWQELPPIPQD